MLRPRAVGQAPLLAPVVHEEGAASTEGGELCLSPSAVRLLPPLDRQLPDRASDHVCFQTVLSVVSRQTSYVLILPPFAPSTSDHRSVAPLGGSQSDPALVQEDRVDGIRSVAGKHTGSQPQA